MALSFRTGFAAVFFLLLVSAAVYAAEEYRQVTAAIGFETVYSGGRYTVSQVADMARRNGVKAIITSDALINRWQYGLWPLRKIVKRTEEAPSVSKYGIRIYLDDIRLAQEANRDVIIIAGLEVAPFYWWKGNPFRGEFSIRDWHKHLIVIGLESLKDIESLPVIGYGRSLVKKAGPGSVLYLLIMLSASVLGIFGILTGLGARPGVYERRYGILLTQWLAVGIAATSVTVLVFINGYPFNGLKYDQYHGDRGAAPYQNLIDYVNGRGGMTFWAHPEADNIEKAGKVTIETREHADLLLQTREYTGFAVFYEGYDIIGRPGGLWDGLLMEYCRGARRSPVWAIGMIDYDRAGSLDEQLQILRTVLLVKSEDKASVAEAMKSGRMYVAKDADAANFRLDVFTAGEAAGASQATMGQKAVVEGAPRVRISGRFTKDPQPSGAVRILIIRDGEPVKVLEAEAPFDITYDDESLAAGGHYYRAEIKSSRLLLVTNPVFVTKR